MQGMEPNPAERQFVYTTSGYTLEGCRENLDQLAGKKAQMTVHVGSPSLCDLSWLGLLPVHTVKGYAQTS